MIALPGPAMDAADAVANPGAGAQPAVDPVLEATVPRVRSWGGDPGRYRLALARGLAAAGGAADHETVRSLAVLAGWRSGVLDLRDDACARARTLPPTISAATLGLPGEQLDEFLSAQQQDRFAWPGRRRGDLVARVGGFRGLGGRWAAPPQSPIALGGGRFRVRSGDENWVIRADVFGAVVTPADAAQVIAPAVEGESVEAVVSPQSYLVGLVRRA